MCKSLNCPATAAYYTNTDKQCTCFLGFNPINIQQWSSCSLYSINCYVIFIYFFKCNRSNRNNTLAVLQHSPRLPEEGSVVSSSILSEIRQ